MPIAVHRICPACKMQTRGATVDPDRRVLSCDLCDAATAFTLLPPLLFVTGASGAGKSTLYMALLGKTPEALLIDQDFFAGIPLEEDAHATNYRERRGLILHLAERLAMNGKPVVIEGTCMPDQYEALGERWYFAKTAYLAVVCSDEALERRLLARPSWRGSKESLDTMLWLNAKFRDEAADFTPPLRLLDTTDRPIADCASELHGWIQRELLHPVAAATE